MSHRAARGFTIVELLVVVSLIVLLLAILLPSFAAAREQARRTVCLSNQHQFHVMLVGYASNWFGMYPHMRRADGKPTHGEDEVGQSPVPGTAVGWEFDELIRGYSDFVADINKPLSRAVKAWECPSGPRDVIRDQSPAHRTGYDGVNNANIKPWQYYYNDIDLWHYTGNRQDPQAQSWPVTDLLSYKSPSKTNDPSTWTMIGERMRARPGYHDTNHFVRNESKTAAGFNFVYQDGGGEWVNYVDGKTNVTVILQRGAPGQKDYLWRRTRNSP